MDGNVIIRDIMPRNGLSEFIRKYQVFDFTFPKDQTLPLKFYVPVPEHCVTFYIKDLQKFSHLDAKKITTYPRCAINGMYHMPINRHGGYDFLAIKAVLEPGALFRLTGLSPFELVNTFIDAEMVWGSDVTRVIEQLFLDKSLAAQLSRIENFFADLIKRHRVGNVHAVDKAGSFILRNVKTPSLKWLAEQSCISPRQFIRKFEERQGLNPKMFERLVRFQRAYNLKRQSANAEWLSVAISCGYYDYHHLAKEFKALTHLSPSALFKLETTRPYGSFTVSVSEKTSLLYQDSDAWL